MKHNPIFLHCQLSNLHKTFCGDWPGMNRLENLYSYNDYHKKTHQLTDYCTTILKGYLSILPN